MKKRVITTSILSLLAVAATFLSCAKNTPDPTKGLARESFDKWMAVNAPGAKPLGDIYIDYIDTTGRALLDTIIVPTPKKTYLRLNYTGSSLDGTVFVSRNKATSQLVGSYSVKTHFGDDFMLMADQSTTLSRGFSMALKNMRQGDSAIIYIPSNLAYSQQFGANSAYNTDYKGYINFPVIMNVRLSAVVENPIKYELQVMENYALEEWNQAPYDTVYPGVYMRKIISNQGGEHIGRDSLVFLNYARYFMENTPFLIATNIDSLAKASLEFTSSASNFTESGQPFPIKPSLTTYSKIFSIALPLMRKDETAEFLVVSKYTSTANEGRPEGKPQILPYQPTRYVIRTFSKKGLEEYRKGLGTL